MGLMHKFWVGEFKRSRTSLEDETRSGRPSDATEEEMCNKVQDLVYSDRQIKVEEIANALHISHGSVSTEQNRTEQNFINLTTSQATHRRRKRRKKLHNEQSK